MLEANDNQAESLLYDMQRHVLLGADLSLVMNQTGPLFHNLRTCTEIIVKYLDAAFARVWVLDIGRNLLLLRASSGLYTHLDGKHSRIPVGKYKIGMIAQQMTPHLTNTVVGDERVSDQEWAIREGMVSFAGYPMIVGGELVGVVAMFGKQPFTPVTLIALSAGANIIGAGIKRRWAEDDSSDFRHTLSGQPTAPQLSH